MTTFRAGAASLPLEPPLGLPMVPLVHDRLAGPLGALATRTIRWAMTSDPSVVARLEASRAAYELGAAG